MNLKNIALNFVPLSQQYQTRKIFRKLVTDSSHVKHSLDIRVRLPQYDGDEEWALFDVTSDEKNEYEEFQSISSENPVLTLNLMYRELISISEERKGSVDYYTPQKRIAPKQVFFVVKKHHEGSSVIIVRPYYLKTKEQFGFLINHKFVLKDCQPFNKITQTLSLSLDKSGKSNIYFYRDKKSEIEKFINTVLFRLLVRTNLNIERRFTILPSSKLDVKTYLVGDQKTAKSQFIGIKSNGPYRNLVDEVRFLFLFSERTKTLATDIYRGLTGRLFPEQFPGLQKMFALPIHKDIVDHFIFETIDSKSMLAIEERVKQLNSICGHEKIMIIAVLPKGYKGVEKAFDAYGHLKLMALRNNAYCQVVTEDTFFNRGQLKWAISNIGLQIFSKLGGAPWLVQPKKTNCLIFGLGSVQEQSIDGKTTKYAAYTVCVDSSGDFKYIKQLSFSSDENRYLDRFKSNLQQEISSELLRGQHNSLVLHVPYKISRKEIEAISEAVTAVRTTGEFEIIVIRINTKHNFLGFSEHNTRVPHESTYIQLSKNEFLVWTEGLVHGKEFLHKRVSEPLYVNFIQFREESATRAECLQEILNLTGANWRGFNSKAQPISILYSRLIASFLKEFSHFENVSDMRFVRAESSVPWFL